MKLHGRDARATCCRAFSTKMKISFAQATEIDHFHFSCKESNMRAMKFLFYIALTAQTSALAQDFGEYADDTWGYGMDSQPRRLIPNCVTCCSIALRVTSFASTSGRRNSPLSMPASFIACLMPTGLPSRNNDLMKGKRRR
jgi:hypothetical protein